MWIRRKVFEGFIGEITRAQVEATVYRTQIKVHETTMDWMRARINQLEKERAQLFYQVSGVKIPIPQVERAPEPEIGANHPFNRLPSFEDMGDEEALKQGIRAVNAHSMLPNN